MNLGEKSFGLKKKTFSTDGYNAQWVHRLPGGRQEPSNLSRSRHSTRNTINAWGCATYHGPGVLHRTRGKHDSYMDILTDQMVQFARDTFPLPDIEDPLLKSQQYIFLCMMGSVKIKFFFKFLKAYSFTKMPSPHCDNRPKLVCRRGVSSTPNLVAFI